MSQHPSSTADVYADFLKMLIRNDSNSSSGSSKEFCAVVLLGCSWRLYGNNLGTSLWGLALPTSALDHFVYAYKKL